MRDPASVIKDKVNVRSEADSQNGAIIDKARTGERLLVTDYGNKWTGIVLPDGKRGYGGKCFPKDVNAFAKMTEGMPLGRLLAPLHELNVHFRGVEERI